MTERNRVQEQQVVDYIAEHTRTHGYPPSTRDIAVALGRTKSVAQRLVQRLAREGILEVNPGIRSVRIKAAGMKAGDEHI